MSFWDQIYKTFWSIDKLLGELDAESQKIKLEQEVQAAYRKADIAIAAANALLDQLHHVKREIK